jgi:hypothetical protein
MQYDDARAHGPSSLCQRSPTRKPPTQEPRPPCGNWDSGLPSRCGSAVLAAPGARRERQYLSATPGGGPTGPPYQAGTQTQPSPSLPPADDPATAGAVRLCVPGTANLSPTRFYAPSGPRPWSASARMGTAASERHPGGDPGRDHHPEQRRRCEGPYRRPVVHGRRLPQPARAPQAGVNDANGRMPAGVGAGPPAGLGAWPPGFPTFGKRDSARAACGARTGGGGAQRNRRRARGRTPRGAAGVGTPAQAARRCRRHRSDAQRLLARALALGPVLLPTALATR